MNSVSDETHADRWSAGERASAAISVVLMILLATAFLPAFQALLDGPWQTHGYSHAYIVAAIAAIIFVQRAKSLSLQRAAVPATAGLLVVAAASLLVRFAHIDAFQQMAFLAAAWFAAACAYGTRGAIRLTFPIAYFSLALPLWDVLIPVLQELTSRVVGSVLQYSNIVAHVSGDFVSLRDGTFEIEDGCAGLHYLLVALAGSLLHGHVERATARERVRNVALAVLLALVTNWVRIVVVILHGDATGMRGSLIQNHYWLGWVLFLGAAIVYLLATHLLDRGPRGVRSAREIRTSAAPRFVNASGAVVAAAVLLGTTAYAEIRESRFAAFGPVALQAPAQLGGWRGPLPLPSVWVPAFPGAAAELRQTYLRDEHAIDLYVAAYVEQGPGRKLIGLGSGPAGPGWRIVTDAERAIPSAVPPASSVRTAELRGAGGTRWALLYWYEVGDVATGSRLEAKWREGLQAVLSPQPSGVVILAARCEVTCDSAAQALETFAADGGSQVRISGPDGMMRARSRQGAHVGDASTGP
jgi:EpsI family protein